MESRKIQRVGQSTLSVSLPRPWVDRHHLAKGDVLLFETMRDGALRVVPGSADGDARRSGEVEWAVDADRCTAPGMLTRVVVGMYLVGRSSIRIHGKKRISSDHLREVRFAASRLMGLGIMAETPQEIILQVAVDPKHFPIQTVMKRLYTLGATMQREAMDALVARDVDVANDAVLREDEADRIYWLTLRLLLTAQTNPAVAEAMGIHEQLPIVGNRMIAKNLEHVADYAHNMALSVVKLLEGGQVLDRALVAKLRETSELAGSIVSDALTSIFSHDIHAGNRAVEKQMRVEALEAELEDAIAQGTPAHVAANLRSIAWAIRRIADYGSEIAVIGINRYLERPSDLCRPITDGSTSS